jgi:hypothetical protein
MELLRLLVFRSPFAHKRSSSRRVLLLSGTAARAKKEEKEGNIDGE